MRWAGRPPSRLLVDDANIVLNAALGLRSVPPFVFVSARREIVTSVRAREEILGRAGSLGQRAESALSLAHEVLAGVTVTEKRAYADLLAPAAEVLRLAPRLPQRQHHGRPHPRPRLAPRRRHLEPRPRLRRHGLALLVERQPSRRPRRPLTRARPPRPTPPESPEAPPR